MAQGIITRGANTKEIKERIQNICQEVQEVKGNIAELESHEAAPLSQPDFIEEEITQVSYGEDLQGPGVLGTGWSVNGNVYTHATNNTDVLAIPAPIKKGRFYKIAFTCTGTNATKPYRFMFGITPKDKDGQVIAEDIFTATTLGVFAEEDYEYFIAVPFSTIAGNFTLTGIQEALEVNSHSLSVKGQPVYITENQSAGVFSGNIHDAGENNLFVGIEAGKTNMAGANNTFLGTKSGTNNMAGNFNTFMGSESGKSNMSGLNNVMAGYRAGYSNTSGSTNIMLGSQAGYSSTTANNNIMVGYQSGYANTTGASNVMTGYRAGYKNTIGSSNVMIGTQAGQANTTSSSNVMVGAQAGYTNTTGGSNVMTGYRAGYANTTGGSNVMTGYSAGGNNTTGSSNVFIGCNAGQSLSDGNNMATSKNSVFIGYNSKGYSTDNQTNQIVIGNNAIGGGSNTITLGSSSITRLRCQVTAITSLSDNRVKEEIEPANLDLCVDAVKTLPVTRYKYKDFTGAHMDKHVTGFLADDVEKVFPKAVSKTDQYFPVLDDAGNPVMEEIKETDADGNETIKMVEKKTLIKDLKEITMTEAVPTLWGAVQKLIGQVEALEAQLALQK